MSAITYDKLRVTAPWEIQTIYELNLKKTLNQHGELYIKVMLTEAASEKAGLQETTNDQIKVYTEDAAERKWLFKGRLKEVTVSREAGVCIITACFLSETIMLDRQERSRSFQNTKLTYDQIVTKVLEDYPNKNMELTAEQKSINGPIIQYQETDWQFIRRLASYLETVIVPDSTMEQQIFSFGYPSGQSITLPDDINYATGKDIKAYYAAAEFNPSIAENQFAYYEVETYEPLNIGDTVTFKSQEMKVSTVYIEIKQGLLVYHTTLVKEIILRQNPIYNSKLQGISLKGTVLKAQDQQVKLHLDIDKEQNPDEAYWYPFAPPTTDALYLMPQMGTIANLYIPGKQEQKALITGCLRTNGAECQQTSDPNTRYLATEYGQELKLAPGGVYFTAGKDNLCLHFDDQQGVILKSHKGMVLEAKEEIVFAAKEKVIFKSPNQILMATPTGSVIMENEIHLRAPDVHIDCTDDTKFSEEEEKKEEEEIKQDGDGRFDIDIDIDWGALGAKAKGAVAMVCGVADGAVSAVSSYFQALKGAALVGVGVGMVKGGASLCAFALGSGATGVGIPVAVVTGALGAVAVVGGAVAIGVGAYLAVDGASGVTGGFGDAYNAATGREGKDELKLDFVEQAYPKDKKWVHSLIKLVVGGKGIRDAYKGALINLPSTASLGQKFKAYRAGVFTSVEAGTGTYADWKDVLGKAWELAKDAAAAVPKVDYSKQPITDERP